jgi:hypothetical protein
MMPCDSKMTTWTLGYSTNNLMDYIELTKVTDRPNGATHSTARATHSTGHRSLSEGLSAAILPRTKCSRRSSRPYSTHIRDLTAPASPSLPNSNSDCCHPSKCQAGCRVDGASSTDKHGQRAAFASGGEASRVPAYCDRPERVTARAPCQLAALHRSSSSRRRRLRRGEGVDRGSCCDRFRA